MKTLAAGSLAVALFAGACGSGDSSSSSTPSKKVNCNAPAADRVDVAEPSFSHPTDITNPLFPRGATGQSIELGAEAGASLRFEVTQLPDTRVFRWDGRDVVTRVTHFVAYKEGRILETATDHYAQDDAGNVWYFGEDVANYEKGVVVNKDGTWFAGKDGPPGMIMPAKPEVGDVYRPENIPGLVFEEVTVKATGVTFDGPTGRVPGAIAVQECLMDGTLEEKVFAPGYGESRAEVKTETELYQVAVAVPPDALPGPVPGPLAEVAAGAGSVFDAVPAGGWEQIAGTVEVIDRAWLAVRKDPVPPLLDNRMDSALDALDTAVRDRKAADARQAAIDVGHATLDLKLRHQALADVDRERLGLWEDQLALDREVGDEAAVVGDEVTIDTIRDRIRR